MKKRKQKEKCQVAFVSRSEAVNARFIRIKMPKDGGLVAILEGGTCFTTHTVFSVT